MIIFEIAMGLILGLIGIWALREVLGFIFGFFYQFHKNSKIVQKIWIPMILVGGMIIFRYNEALFPYFYVPFLFYITWRIATFKDFAA